MGDVGNAQGAYLSGFGPHMVPVTPPGATHSTKIDADDMGKCPGKYNANAQSWYPVSTTASACASLDEAKTWDSWGANVGLALGRASKLVGIDNDVDDPEAAACINDILSAYFKIRRGVDAPGHMRVLYPVRVTDTPVRGTTLSFHKDNSTAKIDILSEGKQFVAWGTHPRTGCAYSWSVDLFDEMDGAEVFPAIKFEKLKDIIEEITAKLKTLGWEANAGAIDGATGATGTLGNNGATQRKISSQRELIRWLALLPNTPSDLQFDDRDAWIGMCGAIKVASQNEDWGRELWIGWCDQRNEPNNPAAKYKPDEAAHVWDSMALDAVRSGDLDWIRHKAHDRDPRLAAQLDFELTPALDDAAVDELAADVSGANLWPVILPRYAYIGPQNEIFDLRLGDTYSRAGFDGTLSRYAPRLTQEVAPGHKGRPLRASDMLVSLPGVTIAHSYTYWPGHPRLVTETSGRVLVNRWTAPNFKHVPNVKSADIMRWLDHIRMVCHGDQAAADILVKYFALVVKRPDVKPNFAPLIMSQPGLGKDMMLVPVQYACGVGNHRSVSADALSNQWTDYLESRFLYVSETRQHGRGNKSSHDVANDLKTYLADTPSMVGIVRKGISTYQVPNLTAWIFFSNEQHPFYIGANDRRMWVIDSHGAQLQTPDYYENLGRWIGDNKDLIASYLQDYPLTAKDIEFFRGHAPFTAAKQRLVDVNRDPVLTTILDIIEDARTGGGEVGMIALAADIIAQLKNTNVRVPSSAVLASLLHQSGAVPLIPKPDGVGAAPVTCSDRVTRRLWLLAPTDDAGNDYTKLTRVEQTKLYFDKKWPSNVKTTATGTTLREVTGNDDDAV